MPEKTMILRQISSPEDVLEVLKALKPIHEEELDKNAFISVLNGLRVIVQSWERDEYEISHEDAIQWFSFFLGIHELVSSSERKLKYFLSSVPIAITYIIGCLQHHTNNGNFYPGALKITFKLVNLMDEAGLKHLESVGKGIISLLWNIIDRVEDYKTQLQVLELIVHILKDLDKEFVFEEVRRLPNCKNDEIIYKILDLLRMRREENLFKKSARSILNQHNWLRYSHAQVQSFYCKTFEIGETMKFIKPTYINKFWFDINKYPRTLTFEGRVAPKNSRKYRDLSVSLRIIEMFQCNNYLNVKFTPPAKFFGIQLANDELSQVNVARISLCKTEQTRLMNFFNVPVLDETPYFEVQSTAGSTPHKASNATTNPSNTLKRTKTKKSSDDLRRKCLSKTIRKQIQQVNPLPKKTAHPLDEFDYAEVSDAEPCQSYRNFTKRNSISSFSSRQLKRPRIRELLKPQQTSSNFNVWDYGPSTSKNARMCHSKELEFDKLRSLSSCSKASDLCKDKIIDLANDSFEEDALIKSPVNVNSIAEKNRQNALKLKTPESRNYFGSKPPPSTSKIVSPSLIINSESQKSRILCTRDQTDCLVYHKRSESESSSENSESELPSSRKRKAAEDIHKSTARKRLFNLTHDPIDSDSDSDFTEIVFVAQKDFRSKMHKMNSSLSSFFHRMFSHQMASGMRKNVSSFEDLGSLVKCIQP